MLKLCLGAQQRIGYQASVAVLFCGCLCCLLNFGRSDIQRVPLHAEGSSLEQNRLFHAYLLSEMGSCVENWDLSSQLAEQVVIFIEHRCSVMIGRLWSGRCLDCAGNGMISATVPTGI